MLESMDGLPRERAIRFAERLGLKNLRGNDLGYWIADNDVGEKVHLTANHYWATWRKDIEQMYK